MPGGSSHTEPEEARLEPYSRDRNPGLFVELIGLSRTGTTTDDSQSLARDIVGTACLDGLGIGDVFPGPVSPMSDHRMR